MTNITILLLYMANFSLRQKFMTLRFSKILLELKIRPSWILNLHKDGPTQWLLLLALLLIAALASLLLLMPSSQQFKLQPLVKWVKLLHHQQLLFLRLHHTFRFHHHHHQSYLLYHSTALIPMLEPTSVVKGLDNMTLPLSSVPSPSMGSLKLVMYNRHGNILNWLLSQLVWTILSISNWLAFHIPTFAFNTPRKYFIWHFTTVIHQA